MMDRKDNNY